MFIDVEFGKSMGKIKKHFSIGHFHISKIEYTICTLFYTNMAFTEGGQFNL